ncbi:MAG TPA: PilZ domain-containing protein [Syntrophorhabdaceae bacterium]|jgi:c-di-GMP-binding flagellar brake protein YcgR
MRIHLGEIISHEVRVSLVCRGGYFEYCRLRPDPDREEGLSLFIEGEKAVFANGEPLSISYSYKSYIYAFETEAYAIKAVEPEGTLIAILRPAKILRVERRKSSRVEPAQEGPVKMTLSSAHEKAAMEAEDISPHGASFVLPGPALRFAPGSTLLIDIELPRFGTVRAHGIVRSANVRHESGSVKYGIEFSPAADFDSPLAQYAHWRTIESRDTSRGRKRPKSVLLAIKQSPEGRQAFFCSTSPVGQVADFGAFSEIISADVIDTLEDE